MEQDFDRLNNDEVQRVQKTSERYSMHSDDYRESSYGGYDKDSRVRRRGKKPEIKRRRDEMGVKRSMYDDHPLNKRKRYRRRYPDKPYNVRQKRVEIIESVPEGPFINIDDIKSMKVKELMDYAVECGLENIQSLKKQEVVFKILERKIEEEEILYGSGVVQVLEDGFGFLRTPQNNYLPFPDDIYIAPSVIRTLGLRTGDTVSGLVRMPQDNERYFTLSAVHLINNLAPDECKNRVDFSSLTPIYPRDRLFLENGKSSDNLSMRVLDLLCPVVKGQRGLIVAPPKSGKTMLLQNIANSILENNPEVEMTVLLIDERPEEVTDMQRNVKAEVISSTFDEPPESHVHVAEMAVERAKRLVEQGKDVVILLDSITRLARAFNAVVPHSGKILSGGVDSNALHKPKQFFGAARAIEEGGSLTILCTVLVDTGSRMEEVVFEELKGRGNMELTLDRRLAEKRIFPAVDISKTGTRREELLMDPEEAKKVILLRQALAELSPVEAIDKFLSKLKMHRNNIEFLMSITSE